MKNRRALTLLFVLVLTVGRGAAAAPQAPTLLAPADNASVEVPFAISWSAVSDPNGIVAYNWQASSVSSFATIVQQNSTNGETQDTVSGLPNGTYFWRVQAVSGAFVQGAWSQAQRFNVTGVGPGEPGPPSLAPTQAYSTFHPWESITFNWTAVPDAATYVLEAATDPSFPIVTRIDIDNIPAPTMTFVLANQGNYWARVSAVNANGIAGVPSNVITFSVFYNNPIGPPPSPVSPPNGSVLTLPVTVTWADVPNPQSSGYELQIAKDSSFSTIEEDDPQLNGPSRVVLSLTAGPKFWRVRSEQGDASPSTAALTAWSSAGTFTIPTGPSRPVSVTLAKDPLYGGETTWVQLQLTSAVPATGATISLASSNPAALPVPATITMPGTTAWTQYEMHQFGMAAGQVTAPTPATITATLNGASASGRFTVMPPSLQSLLISPSSISGGAQPGGIVMLNGQAPAGGAVVSLSSNSPAVSPPTTVAVEPGIESVSFPIPTSAVTTKTTATITATWNGVTMQAQVTLTPQQPPASITLSPTTTVGLGGGSFATVRVATANSSDEFLQVTSSNPAVASVNSGVVIPSGTTAGGFNIFTSSVTTQTLVTISVSGGGVTQSATLTVNPQPPSLSTLTVSPSSVIGGNASTGTVTLTAAAPSGGASIALSSSKTTVASVPAGVTIPAGAMSVTFAVTTVAVTTNSSVTITATSGTSKTATLTITAASAAASLQSVSVSPTSVTGGTTSQGRVALSAGAPQGGAIVALSSANPAVAGVPASVTVPAGTTSATFAVTTTTVSAATAVTISAAYNGVTRSATLTVMPPGQAATLTVTATGRSGERITSSPAGITVAVGSSGSASFVTGTSIKLSVSNGRSATWSGACSSGGNSRSSCTFTITGNASVGVNVQ